MTLQRRHLLPALLLSLVPLMVGCSCDSGGRGDEVDGGWDSGLPPFARIDPLSLPTHPGSSWIRATGSGSTSVTELLVVEAGDPASLAAETRRITYTRIDYEGNREIRLGVVEPDGVGGTGEVVFSQRWSLDMELGLTPITRIGSQTEAIAPLVVESIAFTMNGEQLEVDLGSETKSYSSLISMIGAIDADVGFETQAGAEAAAQLAQLAMLSSETRIDGYGSAGLLMFLGDKEAVMGLVDNGLVGDSITLSMASLLMPTMTLSYANFQDQDGIIVAGAQVRTMSTSGDGEATGLVNFTLRTDIADPLQVVTGSIDFDGVHVTGVYLEGGAASMTLEGNPFTIATDVLVHLDFSTHLPAP